MGTESHNRGIALWGSGGSGKTWLIWAFVKELQRLEEKDPEFSFSLSAKNASGSWNQLLWEPPQGTPTHSSCDYEWRFEKHGGNSSSNQGGVQPATVLLFDDKGTRTVRAPLEPTKYRNTYYTLKHTAKGVLIALDHEDGYSNAERLKAVASLLALLEKNATENKPRYAAVCITKMDELAYIKPWPVWEVIEAKFGKGMYRELMKFKRRGENGAHLFLKGFKVSSVGFLRGTNQTQTNYDSGQNKLRDEDNWYPWRVSEPFLWLFNQLGLT